MTILILWIVSIIATLLIADQKKLSFVGYLFLSILFGPLAVLIALIESPRRIQRLDGPQELRQQFNDLKNSHLLLQRKVEQLEALISKLTGKSVDTIPTLKTESPRPSITQVQKVDPLQDQIIPTQSRKEIPFNSLAETSDIELNFGRNWLNKIGIVVFTLGIGFLISYTFKYFGPFLKIAFGYLVAGFLFFLGSRLESKEKFGNFGRALLGGGWALVYFTTYAMHHFEASRLIGNQMVDLCLLTLVVIGMMVHVLRYKSESMMSVALFVAYVTSTLGPITTFTIFSNLLLAVLILFLVYRFQWVKTLVLGIVLTYGIHYIWIVPKLMLSTKKAVFFGIAPVDHYLFMNFIFLTSYWLVFLLGVHMVKTVKENQLINHLAAVNFGNIALYSFLSYPLVLRLFHSQRFILVLGAGILYLALALAMKRLGREKLYISDMVAAIFAITFSMAIKFLPTTTIFLWLIEVPFLLLIGTRFKEKIFRYLSYSLAVLVGFRLIFLSFWERLFDVHFLGLTWSWPEFMALWSAIAMAISFYLTQRVKKEMKFDAPPDEFFDHFFSTTAWLYLTYLISSLVQQPWIALALILEGILLLVVSVRFFLPRFKIYSYLILMSAAVLLIFEPIYVASNLLKWFIVGADVLFFFGIYFVMKYFNQSRRNVLLFDQEENILLWMGIIVFTFAVFQYAHSQWITLSLGLGGVVLILIGVLDKNKLERLGGLMLLGLTLGRVALVELSGLDIIFKIVTFIVLGMLLLGISFIYNRFSVDQEKKEPNAK